MFLNSHGPAGEENGEGTGAGDRDFRAGLDRPDQSATNGPALAGQVLLALCALGRRQELLLNRALSDFDTKHIITIDSLYQIPVGKGRTYLAQGNWLEGTFLGGWQISAVFRAISGLPWDVREPGRTTGWQIEGYGVQTGPLSIKKHIDPTSGDPAYFNGSTKQWKHSDYGALKFTWEVYNAPTPCASTLNRLAKASPPAVSALPHPSSPRHVVCSSPCATTSNPRQTTRRTKPPGFVLLSLPASTRRSIASANSENVRCVA